jgi:hypothetical protein
MGGIIDEDGHIKQPSQFWELGVVGIAAVFTLAIVGLFFFSFKPPTSAPSNEVSIGIGAGSTIHPVPPKPTQPAPAHP